MKKYIKPTTKTCVAKTISMICTSPETIGIGETVTEGSLDADSKGRSDSWSDFGSEF